MRPAGVDSTEDNRHEPGLSRYFRQHFTSLPGRQQNVAVLGVRAEPQSSENIAGDPNRILVICADERRDELPRSVGSPSPGDLVSDSHRGCLIILF